MADSAAMAQLLTSVERVGKALASSRRLELIDLLAQGERTVESLARVASLGVTTCSAHLQILRLAGLVLTRREGNRIHYRLSGPEVAAAYVLLCNLTITYNAEAAVAWDRYLATAEVPETDQDDLLGRLADDSTMVLDVRPVEEYAVGHIPGALSVPLDELPTRLGELPRDVDLVVYCRSRYGTLSSEAVRLLRADGHRARRLVNGMIEWRLAGSPLSPSGSSEGES
ncbi:metalloregulator ArsR/SmtB family transcription factor [Micromonospora sp. NPDC049374]|uniref:metalloregulator ArsR/SmtB family transcription factor n=1 Tax=unclassified Micromonospora TaxID=2617518 RepID=UPI00344154FC